MQPFMSASGEKHESGHIKHNFLKHIKEDHVQKAKVAMTWAIAASAVFGVFILISGGVALGYGRLYEHRIFPGVRILDVRMDGLTENEARITLNKHIDEALKDGLRFVVQKREVTLSATAVTQEDSDISSDLIRYQIDEPIKAAMEYGRSSSWIANLFAQWSSRMHPITIATQVTLDEAGIRDGIESSTEDFSPAPKDARLVVTWDQNGNQVKTEITSEQSGTELDLNSAFEKLSKQASNLSFSPIVINGKETKPSMTKTDLEPIASQADAWVKRAPITLLNDKNEIEIDLAKFASWTTAEKTQNGDIRLTIDRDRFHNDIRQLINIEQPAKNGTLDIQDGKIVSFEPGSTGVMIDDEATIQGILSNLGTTTTMPLVVKKQEASFAGEDPEALGIKEIIGIGTSDFSGSPTNRQKNITNGVKKVNGTLIAPGEEFSMLKALGEITAENGWYPELVIKGNKTVPELGGGLCQIGTTAFRAALNSGLKITQRRNHSYRVRYYEPAGTDATIYDPAPDFRFKNDTSHHILIHAYIKGTTITYEFWGTRDGRVASVPTPRVYNIVAPPPTKLIETLDLPPGKKNCTEVAHAGADASLDYKVTYADGTLYEETFNSHYRPWQAVCLIGVEKLSEPAGSSSSTPMSAD